MRPGLLQLHRLCCHLFRDLPEARRSLVNLLVKRLEDLLKVGDRRLTDANPLLVPIDLDVKLVSEVLEALYPCVLLQNIKLSMVI